MTVQAPDEMQADLRRIANGWGITRNALILEILRDWLKHNAAGGR